MPTPLVAAEAPAQPPRLIVRMKRGVARDVFSQHAVRAAALQQFRDKIAEEAPQSKTRALPNLGIMIAEGDVAKLRRISEESSLVEYIEEDRAWKVTETSLSAPSSMAKAPWLREILGFTNNAVNDANTPDAQEKTIVAIVDTGARLDHPFLFSSWDYNEDEKYGAVQVDDDLNGFVDDVIGGNVIARNGDVSEVGTDHGTHVAGIVKIVRDQAIPTHPEAANVTLLPIRFIDDRGYGTTSGAITALEYAAQRGAKVINCSWGALGGEAYSQALYDAMVQLYYRDIVVVAAAGNMDSSGINDNDKVPYFPASYNIPSLLSVASMTSFYVGGQMVDYDISSFSNVGAVSVHIAAPGSYVSEYQDGILSANANYTSSFNKYKTKKGTSMAAPVVAGVAAVVRAINPGLSAYEVKDLILKSSSKVLDANKVAGGAMVNAQAAFEEAQTVVTSGERPLVSQRAVAGHGFQPTSLSDEDQRGGGGCGSITNVDIGRGNGLLLLTSLYFMMTLIKRLWRRQKSVSGI
ncbi:MAG TPA: S8 family serine peptidase [Bdellovibrionota bacterium]|nr:S8 family serine peptidase [Bdellovibrionota bacterium]